MRSWQATIAEGHDEHTTKDREDVGRQGLESSATSSKTIPLSKMWRREKMTITKIEAEKGQQLV
jgi:hypothetical protein